MRVSYEEMKTQFKRVLMKKGFTEQGADDAATLFAQNSLAGMFSHGLNRFPRVVSYLDKGGRSTPTWWQPPKSPWVLSSAGTATGASAR